VSRIYARQDTEELCGPEALQGIEKELMGM